MTSSWKCPYCNQVATITSSDTSEFTHTIQVTNAVGIDRIIGQFIVCPNDKCKKYALHVLLASTKINNITGSRDIEKRKKFWQLIPPSKAKAFPGYIPQPILDDYEEACLILDDSPKASATLSRRCIQGMIRDFWKIKKPTGYTGLWRLVEEIEAIRDKVDPLTWRAIDAIRKIGNIGAHMEVDINVIVDVDPSEANKLVELIELLIADWYINKHEREIQLADITKIADKKEFEKH